MIFVNNSCSGHKSETSVLRKGKQLLFMSREHD